MDGFFNSLTESLTDPFRFAQQQAAAFAQHAMPQAPGAAAAAAAGFGGSNNNNNHHPHNGGNKGAPPASAKALKQLPTITVAPEDLVDESNRECCICLEENHLKDRVFRLPCAHIFHQRCIVDWLTKHCTCPVCRYELETDDPQFEKGRRSRMKARKPRVHTYELERMSLTELRALAKEYNIAWPAARRGAIMGKNDIIQAFRNSGRVDVIAAPQPVEYALQELRAMGVGKLKRTMEAAGVFFDPVDVVEKDDMVRIFCNSGRLVLIPDTVQQEVEEEHYSNHTVSNEDDRKPAAITQSRESEIDLNRRTFADALVVETVTDEDEDTVVLENSNAMNMFHVDETEIVPDRGVVEEFVSREVASPTDQTTNQVEQVTEDNGHVRTTQNDGQQDATSDAHHHITSNDENDDSLGSAINNESGTTDNMVRDLGTATATDSEYDRATDRESEPHSAAATLNEPGVTTNDAHIAADYDLFESYSISELRLCAKRLNVDLSQCIERGEMVDKLVQARTCGKRVSAQDLDQWSVLELRALSTAIRVDLSHCDDRTQMIQMLVQESETRPHVANYLETLKRLTNLSVAQLRAVARDWKVNVMDCIEKEEMLHRLVKAATPTRERR